MDQKLFWTVFGSVFLAEIGDKTQLATMVFAGEAPGKRWTVFAAAAIALVLAAAIGVFAGEYLARFVSPRTLTRIAGAAFLAIGVWTLAKA